MLTVLKSQKEEQSNDPSTSIIRGRSLGKRGARFQKKHGRSIERFLVKPLHEEMIAAPLGVVYDEEMVREEDDQTLAFVAQ